MNTDILPHQLVAGYKRMEISQTVWEQDNIYCGYKNQFTITYKSQQEKAEQGWDHNGTLLRLISQLIYGLILFSIFFFRSLQNFNAVNIKLIHFQMIKNVQCIQKLAIYYCVSYQTHIYLVGKWRSLSFSGSNWHFWANIFWKLKTRNGTHQKDKQTISPLRRIALSFKYSRQPHKYRQLQHNQCGN